MQTGTGWQCGIIRRKTKNYRCVCKPCRFPWGRGLGRESSQEEEKALAVFSEQGDTCLRGEASVIFLEVGSEFSWSQKRKDHFRFWLLPQREEVLRA